MEGISATLAKMQDTLSVIPTMRADIGKDTQAAIAACIAPINARLMKLEEASVGFNSSLEELRGRLLSLEKGRSQSVPRHGTSESNEPDFPSQGPAKRSRSADPFSGPNSRGYSERKEHVLHLVNFPFAMASKDLCAQARELVVTLIPTAELGRTTFKAKNGGNSVSIFFPDGMVASSALERFRALGSYVWTAPGIVPPITGELYLKPDQSLRQKTIGKALAIPYNLLKNLADKGSQTIFLSCDKDRGVIRLSVGIRMFNLLEIEEPETAPRISKVLSLADGRPGWMTDVDIDALVVTANTQLRIS